MKHLAALILGIASLCPAVAGATTSGGSSPDDGSPVPAPQRSVEEVVRSLRGIELTTDLVPRALGSGLPCMLHSDSSLSMNGHDDIGWSYGIASCSGRTVLFLSREIGEHDGRTVSQIVDAVLLPPSVQPPSPTTSSLDALAVYEMSNCDLNGQPPTKLYMLAARWGSRESIDWRTGIEAAWTFDTRHTRIVRVSPKGIVCERPEP